MDDKKIPHSLTLDERRRLHITQVTDVDTFDEGRIVLFTAEDTLIIEGHDLHIQKLDVTGGELAIDGEIVSILYSGRDGYTKGGKGFWKKIMK